MHLEALRSLKTEAEREEYLGNITLTMRMKVAEAQSMCADALPAAEAQAEEEAPAPSESKAKEKKRGGKATNKPEAEQSEEPASEAPAPSSGRPQKRAAAQQAEPDEVKKPKKLTAAVEKHMDELAKLKTQKQKEKYIAKLTIAMQTKVAAALSEAEVQNEETEEPESKKRAAPPKEPKDSAKARRGCSSWWHGFCLHDSPGAEGRRFREAPGGAKQTQVRESQDCLPETAAWCSAVQCFARAAACLPPVAQT